MKKTIPRGKLNLESSKHLRLFFMGVGSAFTKIHYQTNFLATQAGEHLLVDCGSKTPQAFFELGFPVTEIRNFFITHSHADHVGGLEEVMLTNRYVTRKKPTIYITPEYERLLWNQTLKGGAATNEVHGQQALTFKDFWDVRRPVKRNDLSRDAWDFSVNPMRFTAFRTKHIPDSAESWKDSAWSTGLVVNDEILFTGDTRYDDELIESFCRDFPIRYIIHDCQLFTGGVHASLDELEKLDESYRNKILLVHYGDAWKKYRKRVKDSGFLGFLEQWKFYDFPELT